MMGMNTTLSGREATLRSAATAALAGIALVQTIELPPLLTQGRQLGLLSLAATALCVGVAAALVVAPASAARRLWRTVSATALAVLAGWAATRVFAVPGPGGRGEGSILGAAGAVLAVAALVAALAAGGPYGARARRLAKIAALLIAVGPGVAGLIIALAPGRTDRVTALASDAHVQHVGDPEVGLVFRAIPGHHGGQWVYQAPADAPAQTIRGVVLALAAAALFLYGAIGYLRRRSRVHVDPAVPLR
jgi:hypothetical protein